MEVHTSVCDGKKTYNTIEEARHGEQIAFWYYNSIQRLYKCPACHKYHLATVTHES